ncbi:VOC family protein [Pseudonocardia sp. TRM90224]|uniref:VOC family protein n=1 Tax=Pseudonocardia sp. TRM90224 TaxID=2812678 RepID=UPI001E5A5F3B|nr:VOC family protein [Pseudonocardia sp. TRM90224]
MIKLGITVVGATDVERGAAFWAAALGLVEDPEWRTPKWRTLARPDGAGHVLGIMYSKSPAEPRPRLHLDLYVDTAAEQDAEVQRLLGLGATRPVWDYPPEPDFVVLCDTEDNVFCVVDLSMAPSGSTPT